MPLPIAPSALPSVRFLPWRGAQYDSGGILGASLLILGESHYGVEDRTDLTNVVVDGHLHAPTRYRLFPRVEQLVTGSAMATEAERTAFWESVAFYNFVQMLLPPDRSGRDPELWRQARGPFVEVLRALRPSAVLVLGVTTWDSLSAPPFTISTRCTPDDDEPIYRWRMADGVQPAATWVNHPTGSRGFSVQRWRPRVGRLVEFAGWKAGQDDIPERQCVTMR